MLTRPRPLTGSLHSHVQTLDAADWTMAQLAALPVSRRFFWSNPDGRTVLGLGAALTLTGSGLSAASSLLTQVNQLPEVQQTLASSGSPPPETRPRFYGGFSFFPRGELSAPWREFNPALFVLPRLQITRGSGQTWLTINAASPGNPREDAQRVLRLLDRNLGNRTFQPVPYDNEIIDESRRPGHKEWVHLADQAARDCRSETLDKVVLAQTRTLTLRRPVTAPSLIQRLDEDDSNTFRFLHQPGSLPLFAGLSPERLVARDGEVVRTESLAGTIRSDESPETRRRLADQLTRSSKNQREHEHVVEFLRDRLSPWTKSLDTIPQSVRSLPDVQHLLTGFRGVLQDRTHVLELVRELHPTPAVGGRPSGTALAYLREHETLRRGFYAAPIGWFDTDGNGDFAVAIRSALVRGTRANLYAGAGIIAESDPETEWDEVQLKYGGILSCLVPS